MRKFLILLSLVLITSCSKNDENNQSPMIVASTMKYTVAEDYGSFNDIYSQKYSFDIEGKVISETFTNYLNPQQNYTSFFEYNNQGKLIKEIKNGQLFCHIIWNGNVAELYNNLNQKTTEFIFDNEKLIEYNYGFVGGSIQNHKYNYDANGNVISEENQNEVYVEYLNYNTSLTNPLHLIKSIGILRLSYKPYFKNFFETEKAYPYDGGDYTTPLTYYGYQNTIDSNNRIISLTDDNTAIYKSKFEYN